MFQENHYHRVIQGYKLLLSSRTPISNKFTRKEEKERRVACKADIVVSIWRIAGGGFFTKRFHYKRCLEAKVPAQTEEVLSGEQESEMRLMRKEVSR